MAEANILVVCAWCKRVSQEDGTWADLPADVVGSTDFTISHGVCPDCSSKMFMELEAYRASLEEED